ncbi:MAG: bifunctional riboflavin kinase/FAD synthetase [Thermodesulfovibrionales bacterium]|nr:bifunctional riboflavin kinase/FAD synthetase [Thermodesulfovibrionales bacterium]
MDILRGLDAVTQKQKGSAVTIGNFDGVHLGHQKILASLKEEAVSLGVPTLALTFDPHPVKLFAPERDLALLTPPEAKARLLERYGIDALLFIEFTREFARLGADEFIEEILVRRLGARAVVVGNGYVFGRGKEGTTDLLRRRGRKHGFEVHVVRQAVVEGKPVSSTRVRHIVSNGNVAKAARLLGRPYSMRGEVITGAGRGTPILKIPTANITTPYEAVPKDGVYAVRVMVGTDRYDGAASLGSNPTFKDAKRSYEVHIFDYEGDLRGRELKIIFIERLRDQKAFGSISELKAQITDDIARCRDILGSS